jgi:hypothetical protein
MSLSHHMRRNLYVVVMALAYHEWQQPCLWGKEEIRGMT